MEYCKDDVPSRIGWAMELPEQIEEGMSVTVPRMRKMSKVCIFGMGNSGLAGTIIKNIADQCTDCQVLVVNDNNIPRWVGSDTVSVFISYSGETKEIVSAYDRMKDHGCKRIVLSSGGRLQSMALDNGDVFVPIRKKGLLPRDSLSLMIGSLATIMERIGYPAIKSSIRYALPGVKVYRDNIIRNGIDRVTDIREEIGKEIVSIYAPPGLECVAIRWKTQLNENCRNVAFCGSFPEFNHNEIVGWAEDHEYHTDLMMICLHGDDDNDINRIFESMETVLTEKGARVRSFILPGHDYLTRILEGILLGDMVSLVGD